MMLSLITRTLRISALTSLVLDAYRGDLRPSGESQLSRRIDEKGGMKLIENSDSALSELAGLETGSTLKVRQGTFKVIYSMLTIY
jgi:hypothetical protein